MEGALSWIAIVIVAPVVGSLGALLLISRAAKKRERM